MITMGLLLLFSFACGGETNPASPSLPTTPTITDPPVSAAKTWTIMVYLAADNDLEAFAQPDINEMKAANSTIYNDVNIIVLRDLRGAGNTKLLKITAGNEEELSSSTLGIDKTLTNNEVNMGSKYTLDKFIRYCKTYFPSTYTMLVIWNHGGGWRNAANPQPIKPKLTYHEVRANFRDNISTTRSINSIDKMKPTNGRFETFKDACWDENSSNAYLGNYDIYWSLIGNAVTIVGFDACLMGMIETAYEVRTVASYMIASEEVIPGGGWNYTKLLNNFNGYGTKSPQNLCKSAVDAYASEYATRAGCTLSAIDLSKVNALISALNNFSTALVSYIDTQAKQLAIHDILYNQTEDFFNIPGDNNIDLWHAADRIGASGVCTTQAAALKTAITNAVINEWHHASGNPNAHGLSIYLLTVFWNDANSNGTIDAGELVSGHSNKYIDSYIGADKIQFLSASTWGLGTNKLLYKLYYTSLP